MRQMTFTAVGYAGKRSTPRKELLLTEMDPVVQWKGVADTQPTRSRRETALG